MVISKKDFCGYLADLQRVDEFDEKLNDLFRTVNGSIETPDACYRVETDLVHCMALAFGTDSQSTSYIIEEIDYFCSELEYGKKWKSGMVTDVNGEDIDMSTSEKLYDYIVSTYVEGK